MSKKGEKKHGTKAIRTKARKLYDQSWTFSAIAREIGFDRNTIARWAKEENWRELNLAEELSPPTPTKKQSQRKQTKATAAKVVQLRSAEGEQVEAPRDELDNLEMVVTALGYVCDSIRDAAAEHDYRGLGILATSLEKLIQLRLKLSPQSARALAQRAIELELTPESFIDALAEQWRLSA